MKQLVAPALVVLFGLQTASWAQPNPNVESRAVAFWSDGVRLAGDLWYPKELEEGAELPAIVLCHGWGGTKVHLNNTYAPKFAAGGFYVLAFDYRGWGESGSRLVYHGEPLEPGQDGTATASVQVIREVVDPFDQLEDIRNALLFMEGEPGVDETRMGLWGTSFGGGLVVYTAAKNPRVQCVVSQVGAQDALDVSLQPFIEQGGPEALRQYEIRRVRGEEAPLPQGEFVFPGLRGTPHVTEMFRYRPVNEAMHVQAPTLLIDAEHEELFDRIQHSKKVYDILKANGVVAKYHVEPGIKHYGIYTERYDQGANLALDWFTEHLKN